MVKKRYSPESIEKKQEEIKETLKVLEEGIKEVFQSKKYIEYLKSMSKFHNYSINNILWIQMQNPNATRVAGLKTWNGLGRKVIKGEKSLKVLAPVKHSKIIDMEKIDPITQKPQLDNLGNPIIEKKKMEWISYRSVPVFDIGQTSGKELPQLIEELKGNVSQFEHIKNSLIKVSKVPVSFEDIKGGSKGYYDLVERRIAIKEGMSQSHTIKTLIHELAHSRLHNIDQQKNIKDVDNRERKEIEAESIAFVISNYLKIDTSDYSFGYIASWSKDKELSDLKASLETIQKETNTIITELEEELTEIKKDKDLSIPDINAISEKQNIEDSLEPFIKIDWSEVQGKEYFKEGEVLSFKEANERFKEAEKEVRELKEIAKGKDEYYPYLKTKFSLCVPQETPIIMRYDIGDGYANDLKEFCSKELNNHKELLKSIDKIYEEKKEKVSVKEKLTDIAKEKENKPKTTVKSKTERGKENDR